MPRCKVIVATALTAILLIGCQRTSESVVIANITVEGAHFYRVQADRWNECSYWQIPTRIDVWYSPGSTITISGCLLDPGVHSGIAPLTLLSNFRAALSSYDATIAATVNLIHAEPHLALPPWGRGDIIYGGDFLSITTATRVPSEVFSSYLEIQADVYTRWFDIELYWQTGQFEFGPWEYWFTEDYRVPLSLHAIPDASTVYLFGVGLAALPLMWLKKRHR